MKLKDLHAKKKYMSKLAHLMASGMNEVEATSVMNRKGLGMGGSPDQLEEMHYQDFFGPGFTEFRNKYLKQKSALDLFVNFNNHYNDPIMKNFSPKTDHEDPSGVYAYPLKYVIDHPMDVRYGKTAKYLRVLRKTTGDILYVQFIDASLASRILYKSKGYLYFKEKFAIFKKHFDSSHIPRVWYGLMRLTKEGIDAMVEHYTNKASKYSTFDASQYFISSAEMTKQFKELGYSAIVDHATTASKAAINKWEPEQVIFLDRGAFEVVDVFTINSKVEPDGFLVNTSHEFEQNMFRKIAAGIAAGIGDKMMSSKAATSNRGGYFVFYTKAGRQIGIQLTDTTPISDKKFGEKKHKEHKLIDTNALMIYIRSEKPFFEFTAHHKDRTEDVIDSVVSSWMKLPKSDEEFVPTRDEKTDDERISQIRQKQIMEKYLERLSSATLKNDIIDYAKRELNIDFGQFEKPLRNYYADFVSRSLGRIWRYDKKSGLVNLSADDEASLTKLVVNNAMISQYSGVEGFDEDTARALNKVAIDTILGNKEKFNGKFAAYIPPSVPQYAFDLLSYLASETEE